MAYIGKLLQEAVPAGPMSLLCFESLDGVPPEGRQAICHRHIAAAFWEQETGREVPELP